VILIGVEVFVIPGLGLFGVLGGVGVLGGIYMSMIGGLPTLPDFAQAGATLAITLFIILVTSWALLRHLPQSSRLAKSGIFLLAKGERKDGWASAPSRPELLGREGVAMTDLRPAGTVLIGEERVDAVSESEWIEDGTVVRVVSSEGYRLVVRPLRPLEPEESKD
jgi:membrane-bound serine protease (ClpP class)